MTTPVHVINIPANILEIKHLEFLLTQIEWKFFVFVDRKKNPIASSRYNKCFSLVQSFNIFDKHRCSRYSSQKILEIHEKEHCFGNKMRIKIVKCLPLDVTQTLDSIFLSNLNKGITFHNKFDFKSFYGWCNRTVFSFYVPYSKINLVRHTYI